MGRINVTFPIFVDSNVQPSSDENGHLNLPLILQVACFILDLET